MHGTKPDHIHMYEELSKGSYSNGNGVILFAAPGMTVISQLP
jgi:hypothetical protein